MSIQNRRQLENTRQKLQRLEDYLQALKAQPVVNAVTRELTKQSLKKLINQMKEEMVVYSARSAVSKS